MSFEQSAEGANMMQEQRRLLRTSPAIDQSLADEREVAVIILKSRIHQILPYNEVEGARLHVMLSIYEGSDL